MNIHKRTKRTPQQREEIYRRHYTEHIRVALLAEEYHVSCPTIYEIPARGRKRDFSISQQLQCSFPHSGLGHETSCQNRKRKRHRRPMARRNESYGP